jgi:tetratricopeptide (TPR) repeat protein
MVEIAGNNMPCALTIAERIILHLARYSKNAADFEVPMEVSQDGIGEALRITRAHVAVEVKKLKEAGELTERVSHVRRSRSKRKVYFLTEQGEMRARNVVDYAARNGISIEPLLDIRKCKPAELMATLSEENRRDLSFASAFRRPFLRSALPESSVNLISEDENGMASLPAEFRAGVLAACSEQERRAANSFAADYWLQHNDYRERLFHLLQAGRVGEAEMLLAAKGMTLSANVDQETYQILLRIPLRKNRHTAAAASAIMEMAIAVGDMRGAEKSGQEMLAADPSLEAQVSAMNALAMLSAGRVAESIGPLRAASSQPGMNGARAKAALAHALAMSGKMEESRRMLDSIDLSQPHGEDAEVLLRIYSEIGSTDLLLKRPEDALRYLSKAMAMAGDIPRPALHRHLAETYAMLGLEDKVREHRRLSGRAP